MDYYKLLNMIMDLQDDLENSLQNYFPRSNKENKRSCARFRNMKALAATYELEEYLKNKISQKEKIEAEDARKKGEEEKLSPEFIEMLESMSIEEAYKRGLI